MVEGCGNSVSKHLNAVCNSPPHYCWRASLKKVGLGCADLERTPFGASDSSHSLDDGHPSLYGKEDVALLYAIFRLCGDTTSILTIWSILLYIDGDVHDLDLISASLHVTDRRLPHDVSMNEKDVDFS